MESKLYCVNSKYSFTKSPGFRSGFWLKHAMTVVVFLLVAANILVVMLVNLPKLLGT